MGNNEEIVKRARTIIIERTDMLHLVGYATIFYNDEPTLLGWRVNPDNNEIAFTYVEGPIYEDIDEVKSEIIEYLKYCREIK